MRERGSFAGARSCGCSYLGRDSIGRLASGAGLKVGRGTDAECAISHDTVSKVHARIYADAGQRVWLEDMGSSNGTYVNGQRVSRVELSPRQTVKFGEVEYRVES